MIARLRAWVPILLLALQRITCGHAGVLVLAMGLAGAAHADVWGYVDAKGVAHFAAERLDDRYELFYRGDVRADAANAEALAPTPRAVAVPSAPPKLIAFFEVSHSFKLVKHHLREASTAQAIDFELLQALIATESGFDPRAVSPKGAVGLMQLIPATAQRFGVAADRQATIEQKLTDPRTNVRAGTRYLRYLINMFPGQIELALAAYNAGEGAVQRAGNKIPNYPETQNYVKTVMQIYTMLKPPEVLVERRSAHRVHVEIPVRTRAQTGGAVGRGNMVAPLMPLNATQLFPPVLTVERD